MPVKDVTGKIIGKQQTSLSIVTKETGGETTTTINDITKYSLLNEYNNNQKLFKDAAKTLVVEKKKNGDLLINGVKLSPDELNQQKTIPQMTAQFVESGGDYSLTYYTNFSDNPDLFEAWGYQAPNNNFLDSGSGPKLDRFVKPISPYTIGRMSDFKMYANGVLSARTTINTASLALIAALGVGLLTWATVVGALTAGTAAAVAAYQLYRASEDGKSAMANSYNILQGWTSGVNN